MNYFKIIWKVIVCKTILINFKINLKEPVLNFTRNNQTKTMELDLQNNLMLKTSCLTLHLLSRIMLLNFLQYKTNIFNLLTWCSNNNQQQIKSNLNNKHSHRMISCNKISKWCNLKMVKNNMDGEAKILGSQIMKFNFLIPRNWINMRELWNFSSQVKKYQVLLLKEWILHIYKPFKE